MRIASLLLMLGFILSNPVRAATADDLEAREAHLATQLRCVVCQNQTVAESNAPLAADMRREIRTQMENGHSDEEVVAFFEQRYGAFVHYKPPFNSATWLLWSAPFLLVMGGLLVLLGVLRRRSRDNHPTPLSETQRARAHQLLQEDSAKDSTP